MAAAVRASGLRFGSLWSKPMTSVDTAEGILLLTVLRGAGLEGSATLPVKRKYITAPIAYKSSGSLDWPPKGAAASGAANGTVPHGSGSGCRRGQAPSKSIGHNSPATVMMTLPGLQSRQTQPAV